MSVIREEVQHRRNQLPSATEQVRERLTESAPAERHLPFVASFEAEPDLAERHEEILRSDMGC
ncbi:MULTISPECIES: hypothetical protein [Microbispora]|uniref:hypothetical protein n=1 Tax=Microbispora TaxID=2005 RepID=UPI00117D8AEB|nr:hypothetical protein [Microbispora rosea]GIH47003.1 hypothetical protein Mro03_21820 [Microbispora rosea subsp. rosea]